MRATTSTRLNITTLMAHLGTSSLKVSGDPDSSGPKEVEADLPDLAAKLASYTYAEPPAAVAERSITDEAAAAITTLRTIANGTSALTLLQLTPIVRGMARVLIVLVRLQLRRFDGTD
jgi:hypothetical protein